MREALEREAWLPWRVVFFFVVGFSLGVRVDDLRAFLRCGITRENEM